jgi:alkaline phosphatase D
MPRVHVTRRELIASAGAAGALAASVPPVWAKRLLARRARVGPGAFRDGVASGEPTATAVTFWSRLTTPRPRSGARLIVAKDPGLRKVVATTVVPTGAALDGALKARLGGLSPATEYFYAWESGTDVSPIGRTRTAPPPDAAERLRIAFSSCQQYAVGYFGAHAHAAAVPDLDLYLFLGDYVYERGSPTRAPTLRRDGVTAVDLRSYRRKYALYRSDPGLRELHRLHPIAHVWDDHEVANNYSASGAPTAAAQRAAAYRAAFEWLPRMTFPTNRHRIYKRFSLGRTADLFLLDERQYRTATADGQPHRLLGDAQMAWLIDGLRRSPATWKLIGQQVVMAAGIGGPDNPRIDAWDGYAEDRARLLGAIERAGIENVVVLSGDAHVFMANLLATDFEALADGRLARPSAVEYVGGSITSDGRDVHESAVQQAAPWNRQYDGSRHGYAYLDLSPDALITEYRATPRTSPAAPTTAFERFVQPAGSNQFARQRL